jgi:hypothetical protein
MIAHRFGDFGCCSRRSRNSRTASSISDVIVGGISARSPYARRRFISGASSLRLSGFVFGSGMARTIDIAVPFTQSNLPNCKHAIQCSVVSHS